ncbi:hypothetical protein L6R53_31625, partial [Myxococcota bacterium]|nr:hypothetical protein [Myxococcota bacterium]
MTAWRRLPLVLAWLALVAMVVATLAGGDRSRPDRSDTQRMRVLPLDRPVAFALDPDEEQVKLVAWLATPPRWARDVRAWAAWRLDLAVYDAQERLVWRGEAWRRTRTGWTRRADGSLLRTSWLPQSRMEVHDSRITLVDVAGLVPAGGQLRVQADSPTEGATVMVAAYRHAWRTRAARLRVLAGSEPGHNAALAARITEDGWDSLPDGWREHLAQRLWERLPALPDPSGQPLRTQALMTAPVEAPWEDQPALGLPVPPGGAVAWNLRQGARLYLSLRDGSGRGLRAAPTWLQLVHADGTTEVRFLGVVDAWGPVVVDEPLLSVQLALDPQTEGPRVVQARLEGAGPPATWGDPAVFRLPEGEGWLVAPDLRSLEMVRTGPALGPVTFPVAEEGANRPAGSDPAAEPGGDLLRLSLRPRLPAAPLPAFGLTWDAATGQTVELPAARDPPVRVEVVALDAAGAELERWETAVGVRPSAFERYGQGDDPGTSRAAESETRYLVPPAGTARLRVSASAVVDVALRAFHPD